jgi:hypothetical protein
MRMNITWKKALTTLETGTDHALVVAGTSSLCFVDRESSSVWIPVLFPFLFIILLVFVPAGFLPAC